MGTAGPCKSTETVLTVSNDGHDDANLFPSYAGTSTSFVWKRSIIKSLSRKRTLERRDLRQLKGTTLKSTALTRRWTYPRLNGASTAKRVKAQVASRRKSNSREAIRGFDLARGSSNRGRMARTMFDCKYEVDFVSLELMVDSSVEE